MKFELYFSKLSSIKIDSYWGGGGDAGVVRGTIFVIGRNSIFALKTKQSFKSLFAILIRLQWANQLKQPTLVRRVQTT